MHATPSSWQSQYILSHVVNMLMNPTEGHHNQQTPECVMGCGNDASCTRLFHQQPDKSNIHGFVADMHAGRHRHWIQQVDDLDLDQLDFKTVKPFWTLNKILDFI